MLKKMSGKHSQPNVDEEVKELALHLYFSQVFCNIPGRCHKAFPSFPKSVLQILEPMKLKQWIIEKIEEFRKLSIYSKENY